MAKALQHHQRERLREALLLAGASIDTDVERPFAVTNVRVGEPYIVAFCETPGHAAIDGLEAAAHADPEAFSDSLRDDADVPPTEGRCAAIGLVRVASPRVGKPTLMITILRYVPEGEADGRYRSLLREREAASVPTTAPAEEETEHSEELVEA